MPDKSRYRLPRTVVPQHYELTLTPDLETARFSGSEKVTVSVVEDTSVIQLNAIELDLLNAHITNEAGDQHDADISLDEESEVATLTFGTAVAAGDWELTITFTGTINDKLRGFYRSTFKDGGGVEQTIAVTQFEATDARRAFPCWDEPDFKSVFGITLIIDEHLAAFSNGAAVENDVLGNGKRQVRFEDTMKMSTYIVAFVVGPLVATEAVDVDGVPLRTAATAERIRLAPFSLESGAAALRFYTDYFKIPYPGGKMDQIGVPDFAFGAMENLGCVTYRETALLVDPDKASRTEVERVAEVVGHEIAHMWFGDLVTMKWWNGIWLNEAFATFMATTFVDHFRPEWERWISFCLDRSAAMAIDSLSSTRPIEFEVIKPEEAQGMFDLLTYEKGASVLRMLEQHLGPDVFAAGISSYLNKHQYGNAETTDLWDALEATSGQPVRAMMDTWIFQGGYPLVSAARNGDTLTLTQNRFRFIDDGNDTSQWHVPVGIRAHVNGEAKLIKAVVDEGSVDVELPTGTEWFFVNDNANGFFRTSYDDQTFNDLLKRLPELAPHERFTLMSDTWASCLAGRTELGHVLQLVESMNEDTDPNVWAAMSAPLRMTDKIITDSHRQAFTELVRRVALPLYEELGWDPRPGEKESLSVVRAAVIGLLGGMGAHDGVRDEALRRYDDYEKTGRGLDPNVVGAVEGTLAAIDTIEQFDRLVARFKSDESTPQDQVRAVSALASFSNSDLVDRLLAMIIDNEVRTQDAPYAIRVMLGRRQSGERTWAWCEQNWSTLTERFPDNSIVRMLDGVSAQASPDLAARVQAFMAEHPVPQAQKSVDQTCETLRVNAAFYDRNINSVAALFSQS